MREKEQEFWREFWEVRGAFGRRSGRYEEAAKGSSVAVSGRIQGRRWNRIRQGLNLRPGGVVLDGGCGNGAHIPALAGESVAVIGLDFAHNMVVSARERTTQAGVNRVGLVQGSVTQLPLRDESIDAIFCQGVLTCLPDDDVHDAFREFARVLRPGGRLVVHVKNSWSIYGATLAIGRWLERLGRHVPRYRQHYHSWVWYGGRLRRYFTVVDHASHGLHPVLCPAKGVALLAYLELLPAVLWRRLGVEFYFVATPRGKWPGRLSA